MNCDSGQSARNWKISRRQNTGFAFHCWVFITSVKECKRLSQEEDCISFWVVFLRNTNDTIEMCNEATSETKRNEKDNAEMVNVLIDTALRFFDKIQRNQRHTHDCSPYNWIILCKRFFHANHHKILIAVFFCFFRALSLFALVFSVWIVLQDFLDLISVSRRCREHLWAMKELKSWKIV